MQKLEFRAMGCQMMVALDSEADWAMKRLEQVPGWFEDWEQSLSRFRFDSELVRLNANPGEWRPVSQTLWDVLQASLQAAEHSQGLITSAILPALETAGYTRSFNQMDSSMQTERIALEAPAVTDMGAIQLNVESRSVWLPPGMQLDFGGVAKGWAAHQAMRRLQDAGPVLVNAGGDISISSPRQNGETWTIGVIDPEGEDHLIEMLYLDQGAVATSGRDYRRWMQNGRWQHHIIDPRTNLPAATDLLSATVIAQTAMQAEMAAKMVFILGSREGFQWLDQNSEIAGLAVLENGEVLFSQGIEKYLKE